jgi:membrane-associated phospholipid phosphatase
MIHCCFFMEETFTFSVIGHHFLWGQNYTLSIQYLLVLFLNLAITVFGKKWIGKPRPGKEDFGKVALSKTTFFRDKQHYNYSMPSGDAMQAFAMITYYYYFGTSCLFWAYLPIGVLISVSRIYLLCHYISDVIVGALIGIFGTAVLINVVFIGFGLNQYMDYMASRYLQYYVIKF